MIGDSILHGRMRLAAAGFLFALVAGSGSCSDGLAPGGRPDGETPVPGETPVVIVSNPVMAEAAAATASAAMLAAAVAYVSLVPGTYPAGRSATISNRRTGVGVRVDLVAGGLDPVPIAAEAGDTLAFAIDTGGVQPARFNQLVPLAMRPTVVRTDPPPRKRDVSLNSIVVIVFSEPLDGATMDTASLKLWRGTTPVAGTVRFADAAHLRVEFHPDGLLAPQTDYQLIVTQAIRDLNGLALDSVTTVPFTTGSTGPSTGLVFASVSVGWIHTCGVTTAGAAYCWGDNSTGTLGNGSMDYSSSTPVPVAGGLTFATVSASAFHTCGVTTSGAAYCWGVGGQLGDSIGRQSFTPLPVAGGLTFASMSAAYVHSCGVTTAGAAYCWGEGYFGELGVGSPLPYSATPAAVGGGLTFASVSAGASHTCGVTTTGAAYCWGMNTMGELGVGTSTGPEQCQNGDSYACSTIPVAVAGGLTFATVSAGAFHTCGVTTSGAPYCWGNNVHDLLGSGTNPNGTPPQPTGPEQCVDVAGVEEVAVGPIPCSRVPGIVGDGLNLATVSTGGRDWFACGLTSTGVAYCWGGTNKSTTAPVAVPGGLTFATLSAGLHSACGVTTAGVAYCWGANERGQLGDGTTTPSSVPVRVAGQP